MCLCARVRIFLAEKGIRGAIITYQIQDLYKGTELDKLIFGLFKHQELVREYEAGVVVIGLPKLLSGEEGDRAEHARVFGAGLQKRLPRVRIAYWDERLSTVEAERLLIEADVRRKRRKQVVDGLAEIDLRGGQQSRVLRRVGGDLLRRQQTVVPLDGVL